MSKNSQASIFGGFTQNEFDELVRKISNGEPIYQKEPKMKQMDIEQYIKEHNQRLIDFYADKSLDELKDDLVKAQEKHSAAVLNQQRTGLNSDKIHIEDTSVRIQNLITIIKHRESGEQS